MLPGTANTSLLCSTANRAVMAEPLCWAPSITITPSASPLTIRFRMGKFCGYAGDPMGNSERMRPRSAISWAQLTVVSGIEHVNSAPEDCDCLTAHREGCTVCGGVNPASHSTRDG